MIIFSNIYKYPTYDEYQRIKKFKQNQCNLIFDKKKKIKKKLSYQDYLNKIAIVKCCEPHKKYNEPCIENSNNTICLNFKC